MNVPFPRLAAGLLGSLCALAAAGCADTPADPAPAPVGVRYAQTYCADRWGPSPGPQRLVAEATAYLAQQGLTLRDATASAPNPAAGCNACACTTGLVLAGTVAPAELPAVLALGFTRQ